ncbi:uncharacterized protein LOC129809412 [Phlebotomus papatasi]|uniref:uncharacterized protein LOC129809412 n=1 Tax=Phlebotomus papatasi TaxID=29031 RepID=UPI002483F35B|nr:uncharacterized protein LOC129809412 [Phlebotomus papatasi]
MIERSDIPQSKYGVARRFACSCCPYGYHIDLDFVKYCETLHRTPPISRRVRSARRQRHSMDIMMGFISVPEPTPAPTKNTEYDSICATDALADAVCNFEMTLLSAAVKTEAKIAEPEPEGGRSALEYAREQMAQHLGRIRSLEEQLKVIPALRLQIDMLTEEKRRLEGRLLLSPKLSCRRDVGSQCIGIGQENAYTNTERIAMIPKQLQCSPNIESRLTQTAAIVTYTRATSTEVAVAVQSVMRDASTLTDMQVLAVEPETVAAIPSISTATQTFAHQSTDKYQQTDLSVVSRGLQCDIRPATVEVRMQTIDPIVIYAETQTPSQELSCSETQTEEIIFDVSEDSEMEDEDNESLKSPLSAINEDTEERET